MDPSNLALAAARGLSPRFSAAYLECRLDPGDPRVDLLACVRRTKEPPKHAPRTFGGEIPDLAGRVLDDWDREGTALHRIAPLVWLEYDDVGNGRGPGSPSVCVCIERDYLEPGQFGPRRSEDWIEASAAMLDLPACPEEARRSKATLEHIFASLPTEGRPIQFSVMSGRQPSLAKLYARVPTAHLFPFLADIGWRGSRSPIDAFLAAVRVTSPLIHVDLTLGPDGILPQVGLAFPALSRGHCFDEPLFRFAAAHVGEHATAAGVAPALRRWADVHPTMPSGGAWPQVAHRWIDQKVVFPAAGPPQLKVYLGLRIVPLLLAAMRSAPNAHRKA